MKYTVSWDWLKSDGTFVDFQLIDGSLHVSAKLTSREADQLAGKFRAAAKAVREHNHRLRKAGSR